MLGRWGFMSVGRSPSWLVRQEHGYCFRLHIPSDLSRHFQLTELRYSLGCVSKKQARVKASRLGCYVWELIEQARYEIKVRGYTNMDRDRIKSLIYEYFQEELNEDEKHRLDKPKPSTRDELEGE